MNLAGEIIKGILIFLGGLAIIAGSVLLLLKHGRALERVESAKEKDKEYEKMQQIHSANSSKSASERLDWLRKHKKS